jgi:hypothetical protein
VNSIVKVQPAATYCSAIRNKYIILLSVLVEVKIKMTLWRNDVDKLVQALVICVHVMVLMQRRNCTFTFIYFNRDLV